MQPYLAVNALEKVLKYLDPFLTFANSHMVDFYTNNLYEKYVPFEIREEINNLNSNEVLDAFWNTNDECIALNNHIKHSREHTLHNLPHICLDLHELEGKLKNMGCNNLSGLQMNSFMSSKKSHEVEIMSKITSAINEIANTSHIIDIGDGKGYLSSALTIHNKMKVLGIDASPGNTVGAAKRVAKLNRVLRRTENKLFDSELYKQTTRFITESTNLNEIIGESFPGTDISKFGLVGLHTCGDLAPSSLRIYHSNQHVKTLCNVGCCYHLLTEKNDQGLNVGFPMSNYLQNQNIILGRNARMISAQSLERMIHDKEAPSEILFYRALLQVLILKHAPECINCQAGRFKKSATFTQYVRKAFSKFQCPNVPSEEVISELYDSYLPKRKELDVFYMFRAYLAPVIEAVILLDRLVYLHELGYHHSYLVKFFDSYISPRCYGIVSLK